MDNFVFCNPTRILFGKGQIHELSAWSDLSQAFGRADLWRFWQDIASEVRSAMKTLIPFGVSSPKLASF